MKEFLLTFLTGFLLTLNAVAQTDSLTFVKTKWEIKKIAKGIQRKHYWFKKNLFNANENINILEINPRKTISFAIGYEKQLLKTVSDFAKETNPIAAINGSFFDVKNGGAVDMIRVNGEVISPNRLDKTGNRDTHQQAAIVFNKGKISIAKWDGTADWENKLTGDIMDSGPLLVYHGAMEKLIEDTTSMVKVRHPRTAVAITRNRVLLITIDGRNENAAGLDMHELGKLLKWLKAVDGINLDGGGSTTLWLSRETPHVVNYPTDNKKWDHEGERKVANVILVK